jgi:hypothetical protein
MIAITIIPATMAIAATAEACTGEVVSEMYWVDFGRISTNDKERLVCGLGEEGQRGANTGGKTCSQSDQERQ